MNRIIRAEVRGEQIGLSSAVAGAAGSHRAVTLELSFDGAWEGTTKMVYFTDALRSGNVCVILTTDLLKDGEAEVYLVPIPAEPLKEPGEMRMTVRGVTLAEDGVTVDRVLLTAETGLLVLRTMAPEPGEGPTATQTEQLQAEIEDIKADIVAAAQAAAAREDARAAATVAEIAQEAAEAAQAAAETAQAEAETARAAAETAQAEAETARAAAETAGEGAEAARQAIENLSVAVVTGAAGSAATVNKTVNAAGAVTLTFTVPQGIQGEQGPQGIQGIQGPQGEAGESAYAIAQAGGYTGTEAEFRAELGTIGLIRDGLDVMLNGTGGESV